MATHNSTTARSETKVTPVRPEGISIDAFPDAGFALLRFDGTDLPPIRLRADELSYVGGAIAGTETTIESDTQ